VRLCVDTAPVIYSVQQVAPFAQKVDKRLATPGLNIVTSNLTRMECLVLPIRNGDKALIQDFETWLSLQVDETVPFTESAFRRAAEIRAGFNFRTPDALHLAVALEGGCTAFFTNDARLSRFPDLTVELV
jgi:predicted nucleic acid-binding protein